MTTIPSGLLTHFKGASISRAKLIKITRSDGLAIGGCNIDRDIIYPPGPTGFRYRSSQSNQPSVFQIKSGLSISTQEISGFIDGTLVKFEEIESGYWNFAAVECITVNYLDLSLGHKIDFTGELGEVQYDDMVWTAEIRGIASYLTNEINRHILPTCDARFGDARCGVNKALWTDLTTITNVGTAIFINVAITKPTGWYDDGEIKFLTGPLAGRTFTIKAYNTSGALEMKLPLPALPLYGDSVDITAGCNKLDGVASANGHCKPKFDNLRRFKGMPWTRGNDDLNARPSQTV